MYDFGHDRVGYKVSNNRHRADLVQLAKSLTNFIGVWHDYRRSTNCHQFDCLLFGLWIVDSTSWTNCITRDDAQCMSEVRKEEGKAPCPRAPTVSLPGWYHCSSLWSSLSLWSVHSNHHHVWTSTRTGTPQEPFPTVLFIFLTWIIVRPTIIVRANKIV